MKKVKLLQEGREFYMPLDEFNMMIENGQRRGYPNDSSGDITLVDIFDNMNKESQAINDFITAIMKKAERQLSKNELSKLSGLILETCIEMSSKPISLGKLEK